MASIVKDGDGLKRIQVVCPDGQRRAIRLGKVSMKQAEAFKVKVESLIGGTITGSIDDETSRWLAGLDEKMHARLAVAGLVKSREQRNATLAAFIDAYAAGRTDIKPNTRIQLGQARAKLVAFFGADKRLADITAGDAEEYWRHLSGKLAVNSARRLCGRAKQLFSFAVRKRIIRDNPFAEIESHVRSNPERQFFITADVAKQVMDACPDAEWRLIFALSRYGGLRCPSEHLALKWADVDWERNRLRVPSPKTEHIEGRASRIIPLFPELRKPLLEVFEQAAEGAEHIITRYRAGTQNLRTQFQRIIRRAGLEPWPKLFHNLRASRQTELAETMPGHVVCAWLGNTADVAREHYLQVTDAHFAVASAATDIKSHPPKMETAQNAAQYPAESQRTDVKVAEAGKQNRPVFPSGSAAYETVPIRPIPRAGIEPARPCGQRILSP